MARSGPILIPPSYEVGRVVVACAVDCSNVCTIILNAARRFLRAVSRTCPRSQGIVGSGIVKKLGSVSLRAVNMKAETSQRRVAHVKSSHVRSVLLV